MNKRSFLLSAMILFLGSSAVLTLQAQQWVKPYRKARSQAIAQKKKLLIYFSGSDWCMEGRRVERTLFRSRAFRELSREKYVLYNADFPRHKVLGQEATEYNRRLANRYGIHHYPAVILIDPRHGSLLAKHIGIRELRAGEMMKKLEKIAGIKKTVPAKKKPVKK